MFETKPLVSLSPGTQNFLLQNVQFTHRTFALLLGSFLSTDKTEGLSQNEQSSQLTSLKKKESQQTSNTKAELIPTFSDNYWDYQKERVGGCEGSFGGGFFFILELW